ncbi:hypothetical protein [Krasilnikovia sp. M28-CT-15]|uniref:hypothetical protein n=1 Tax=Krasilnikovia sp. M28-CT-15 TaxID=3373540 RepID=UPI003876D997
MSADAGPATPPRRSAGGRVRLALALVVAAVGVAAAWVVSTQQAANSADTPVTEAQVAAHCVDSFHQLNGDIFGEPVQRLITRNGDSQVRVYVAGHGTWITICHTSLQGDDEMFGTVMEPGRADQIRLFGGEDSVLKANVLLGHLPKGASTIMARLPSGQVVTGAHDGDVFLIWAPGDSVRGARLTAARPDGTVVDTAAAPGT